MKSCAALFLPLLFVSTLSAQEPLFAVRDEGESPSRAYDVVHYRIEVSFDEPRRKVIGTTAITLVPFPDQVREVTLDAEHLDVTSVTLGSTNLRFTVHPKTLAIMLDRPYTFRDTLTLSIGYSCTPARGLFFVQPDSAYPDRPWQIWTQGEDMDNHFWFPCHDFPDDVATSEVIATVRDSYAALSNGRLVSVTQDKKKKTKTFHWSQDIPHVSYLIMLAAGEYAVLKDRAGSVPVEYWVYPSHVEDAKVCFAQTPAMITWFSEKIGYPYAWAKYAQVLIRDYTVGGMENTSATGLADNITVYDARARVDEVPTSLIAHELAHQWWGDVVTCRDWRHLWLNESFASYFDPLWHEAAFGRDEFDYTMYQSQQSGITSDRTAGRKPIVSVGSYGSNLYPRGASVLHMLRFVLGDRLFWKAMHHYITKYQHTVIETNDLKVAIEEATGQNLFWFFDQWLYKAGYPVFALQSTWNDSSRSLLLGVRQTQKMDSLTGVFRTPVDIELTMPEGSTTSRVNILSADTTFVFHTPSKPTLVVFDKGNWLLKELHWAKSADEWKYQATRASNPVDRVRAVQELVKNDRAGECLPVLATIAGSDRMWAVRREALYALEKMDSLNEAQKKAAAGVLVASAADAKSAVRQTAVYQMRGYRGDNVTAALTAALKDSSYRVVGYALRSLARADSAHALPALLAHLSMPSHNNIIEIAALAGLSVVDTAKAVEVSLPRARYGNPQAVRLEAFRILGRYGKGRNDVGALYASVLSERSSFVRGQAIRWLGENGDVSILPRLQAIANDTEDRSSDAARASVEKIKKRTAP
jgi:aminopeptidase N